MSFDNLGLSDSLLRAVQQTGYTSPTPIQARAIPAILGGGDVMAAAQTGTGKTAGFTLPLLQLLSGKPKPRPRLARALVITPTRELAAQVQESIETYGCNERMSSAVVFGGVNINPQIRAMQRGVDILVATPGRLLDLYQQKAVGFDDIEILVLDEADRMLDMGFIRDIRKILALLPGQRQNLLFSATFSDEIRKLAKSLCHDPEEIDVAPRNSTVETISQMLYPVEKERKADLLSQLLRASAEQTLVFSRTKHGANKLAKRLTKDGVKADAIHGNKSQSQRTRALAAFKDNQVQVLVATDIAARGIDIDELAQVINFDLPNVPEDYVHRIGRTGRAGASGQAISLVSPDESKQLKAIERLMKRRIERADAGEIEAAPARSEAPHAEEARGEAPRQEQGQAAGEDRPARRRRRGGRNRSGQQAGQENRQARAKQEGRADSRQERREERSDHRPARAPQPNGNKPRNGRKKTEGNMTVVRSTIAGIY